MVPNDTPQKDEGKDGTEDLSQYIRTYAKDMAAISGNIPAEPEKKPKKGRRARGIVLPEVDTPFFSKPAPPEREIYNEVLPPAAELESIIERTPAAPAPEAPPVVPAADAEREAVLARLRQKLGDKAGMAIQSYPPAAHTPSFMPPADAGTPVNRLPPLSREPGAMPLPPLPKKQDAGPSPIHTYTSDFADRIDSKSASTFSVLAAEQDAGASAQKAPAPKKSHAKAYLFVLGAVLIILGSGGAFAAYRYAAEKNALPIAAPEVPSLVAADGYQEVSGSGPELLQRLAAAESGALADRSVTVTYLAQEAADAEGFVMKQPQAGGVLIAALDLPMPDILLRNIAPESTVGIVRAGNETRVFFVLRANSYERTFAGMLAWEPAMGRDLEPIYPLYPALDTLPEAIATTTASTTPLAVLPSQAYEATTFTDAVVANHDVRVLKDTAGKTLLLYGYADKETLLIVRDEAAFAEILSRLGPSR